MARLYAFAGLAPLPDSVKLEPVTANAAPVLEQQLRKSLEEVFAGYNRWLGSEASLDVSRW